MPCDRIFARSAYVVLSFIPFICINAHCDTIPSSYILVSKYASISTVLTVVCDKWHMSDIEYSRKRTRMVFIRLKSVDVQKWQYNPRSHLLAL